MCDLVAKKKAIEDEFNQLKAKREQAVKQIKDIQTAISQIDQRQLNLQGRFQALTELEDESKKEDTKEVVTPDEVITSKKEEKKK